MLINIGSHDVHSWGFNPSFCRTAVPASLLSNASSFEIDDMLFLEI